MPNVLSLIGDTHFLPILSDEYVVFIFYLSKRLMEI